MVPCKYGVNRGRRSGVRFQRSLIGLGAGCLVAFMTLGGGSSTGLAQESFYQGKSLNVIVRSGPGGGNDFYGRLLARHMVNHIPGSPSQMVTNMPGGGGLVAANYLAERARRDGTEIGVLDRALPVAQRMGASGVRYDVRTLNALGSASAEAYVWLIRSDHPLKDAAMLRDFPSTITFAGTGAGNSSVQQVTLVKADGFPVEIIIGFSGTAEKVMAVVRGDTHGTNGTYESLLPAIRNEGLRPIARLGMHPDLSGVPDLREILSPDRAAVARLMVAPLEAGRPFYAPPGVPAERVRILRDAFRDALKDPALLEEARRGGQSISWVSGEDMDRNNRAILETPDSVVEIFRAL